MTVKLTLASLIAIILTACGGGGGNNSNTIAPTATGLTLSTDIAPADLSCTDYTEYALINSRYANNVWNKQAAGSYPYVQCIRQRGPLATKELGWRWNWPSNSDTVFGYPEVVIGWKPWNGGKTTNEHLPIKVNAVTKFDFSFDVETATNGKHNLATSMWLTSNGLTYNNPTPTYITTEFMIWTDGFDFQPAGSMLGQTVINGITFEVWYAPVQRDASGQNNNAWKYIAYRATTPHLSTTLDIKQILNDAVGRGIVSPSDYVSNIELGNEVMSGVGETWVKSLTLDVQ